MPTPDGPRARTPQRVAAIALTLLLAGACGGDDGDAAPPTTLDSTSSSTAEPATTSTTEPGRAFGEALAVTPIETPTTTAADGTIPVTGLAVGECADILGAAGLEATEVTEAQVLPCDEPHAIEVVAIASLDDDPAAPYPGDQAVLRAADDTCLAAFAPYVGVDYVDSSLEIVHLRPDEDAWGRDDRSVLCAIVDPSGAPLVGSVAGSGR